LIDSIIARRNDFPGALCFYGCENMDEPPQPVCEAKYPTFDGKSA
jgi:hypothetical protein